MTYTKAASLPKTKFAGKRRFEKLKKNLFWSLLFPILMIILANVLAGSVGEPLFYNEQYIFSYLKGVLLCLIACLALNTNLNSGRMDFSLGATGILGTLLAFKCLPEVETLGNLGMFILLAMIFSAIIGLFGGIIYILLKIPPIVTSMGMCLIYEGIAKLIVGANTKLMYQQSKLFTRFLDNPVYCIAILVVVMIVMACALCYTKYGYDKLALVYDQKISVDTGLKEVRSCIASYIIAGALIGLWTVLNSTSIGGTLDIKIELGSSTDIFKNFLPIFIGGILAKYNNQIVGLTLAIFSTQLVFTLGMEPLIEHHVLTNEIRELIRGFSVFAVLVYMVDKDRFLNWVKMQRYILREKRLKPEIPQPQVEIE